MAAARAHAQVAANSNGTKKGEDKNEKFYETMRGRRDGISVNLLFSN